ncbi:NfeD family protein [Alcanivorax sp. 1008]|uniref:NfeD family protein n=1 Tax=Alcanivorax sp. 1008 TaxID=2816853 RepID=UPI001DA40D83|nr:NfeD family protein [Alcanivorax sp. 1008]MCC1495985.1 NfeD family protein [Alcanivorax sp. 1008]
MDWLYQLDYHHWIVLGLVLLVLEVFVGGSLLMWNGLSAICVGILVLLLPLIGIYPGWEMQLIMFGVGGLVALYAWRRYINEPVASDAPALNRRGASHVGEVVRLDQAIDNGTGYIHLDDTRWPVHGPDLPEGSLVRLVALDDMAFQVEQVDNPPA